MKTIIGICGSLRREAYSKKLLNAFAQRAPDGFEVKILDISQLPLYNDDLMADMPPAVTQFKQAVKPADGVLFVTPEYNRSFTPATKNAIDWASRPYGNNSWDGKPAAIAGVSPGPLGALGAVLHLRQVLVFPNMIPLQQPEFYLTNAADRFDDAGKLTDKDTEAHIINLWAAFAAHITRFSAAQG